MGWYDTLSIEDQTLARGGFAGLAVIHTQPFAKDSGQRWVLFPYMRLMSQCFQPKLLNGGRGMIFMPPRHGKSLACSVYAPSWFVMFHQTKDVILTSYGEELAVGFSARARGVVDDLGHIFGVRVHPKQADKKHWQIQYLDDIGEWRNGGNVYAAGANGALPGRGGHLIVMDDVVRGHKDTTQPLMEKTYNWYRAVLETRMEPNCCMLLAMTRWADADLAGRLLEDEGEDWDVISLPGLAKEDDLLDREPGEALCPSRYNKAWLERKRDSSDEGGIIFEALYQQDPFPEGGIIIKAGDIQYWHGTGEAVQYGNQTEPYDSLKLWFATIDPALKKEEINDPTGFLVWAIGYRGALLLMEDHTKRMAGSDDLIPLMKRVRIKHPGIQFFVESQSHGTEIMRAAKRAGVQTRELKADKDKITRWIGCQPAFASGDVWLPAKGGEAVQRELLTNPGAKHDDRFDCVAYAVQVWRDRAQQLSVGYVPKRETVAPGEQHDVHPEDRVPDRTGQDQWGRWLY